MGSRLRVLMIEDSANDARLLERSLRKEWSDLIVQRVDTPEALEEALSTQEWDVVLSDENMPRFSAGAALDILKRRGLALPCIVVSGLLSMEGAVGLMKAGAHDFVRKDDLARLAPAIRREIRDAEVRRRRRQAELAVKESEEKYRRLVENLASGYVLYSHDTQGVFTYVSPSVTSVLGYSPEEFLTHYAEHLTGAPVNHGVVEHTAGTLRGEPQPPYQVELCHQDGSLRTFEVQEVPVLDENGQVTAVEGVAHDVTAQRRMVAALAASEERFRLAMRGANDGLWDWNLETDEVYYSPRWKSMLGYADEEVGASPDEWRTRLHPDDLERVSSAAQSYLRGETDSYEAEFRMRHKDGHHVDILARALALRDARGKALRLTGTHVDVSERNRAARELRDSESRVRLLLDSTEEGIYAIDTAGVCTMCNPAAARLLGYSQPQALLGKVLHGLVHHSYPDGTEYPTEACRIHRVVLDGTPAHSEDEMYWRADGTRFPAEVRAAPIRRDGAIVGAVVSFFDITQRKETERTLRRLSRAQTALSRCNAAMVRASDEAELTQAVCDLLVDVGGYRLAWVGSAEPSGDGLRLVVVAGDRIDVLESEGLALEEAERELARWCAALAVRTGQRQVVRDLSQAPDYAAFAACGHRSCLSVPLLDEGKSFGTLSVHAAEVDAFDAEELALLEELASDLAYGIRMLRTQKQRDEAHAGLEKSLLQTIEAVALTVEKRDPYTAGHQRRVAQLAAAMAEDMGLSESRVHGLRLGAMIHDIGKIYIPAEILTRPGKLSEVEFKLIQTHPEVGFEIMRGVEFPWPVQAMILQHHERLDGSGYPRGLRGEDILREAKILGVADVVEAMASHRPFRVALGIEVALQEIQRGRGTLYDPEAVDSCVRLFGDGRFKWESG